MDELPADRMQRVLPESRERGHEVSDLSAARIALFLLSIVLVTGLLSWAAHGLLGAFRGEARREEPVLHPLAEARQVPPAPRLQIDVRSDVDALRARERRLLETYGWVDRDAGVVRIPVERAMKLLAERGLPAARTPQEDRQ